ncbi:MAG: response regulator [Pseudomonadales bacterium]|nr:response regulator [Pseudomonadales bacterium]
MTKPYILCVDDERTILMSLRAQLRHWYKDKYNIEIAESAEEGLELIKELLDEGEQIAVVISDWLMPGMKGDEFLILVHEHYPELTKIMLTGHADPEAVERTKQLTNLSGCVNKPWTQADFYSVLPPEQEET